MIKEELDDLTEEEFIELFRKKVFEISDVNLGKLDKLLDQAIRQDQHMRFDSYYEQSHKIKEDVCFPT